MATRYIAVRVNGDGTDTIIDPDLPLSGVSYTRVLNGATELEAKIAPEYAYMYDENGQPFLQKWSTAIFIETDGDIRAGGIFVDDTDNPGEWKLDLMGYAGYPTGMPYVGEWKPPTFPWRSDAGATQATVWKSVYAVDVDPLDVLRKAWSHLQEAPRGDLGVVVDSTTSPLRIGKMVAQGSFDTENGDLSFEYSPVRFSSWETHDLGDEISKLSEATPFDFLEVHEWDPMREQIVHRIKVGYPRLGRRRDDVRFVFGENVQVSEVGGGGDGYASEVLGLGAGEERTMLQSRVIRGAESRLRRVSIIDEKQAKSQAALNALVQAELQAKIGLEEVTAVKSFPDADDLLALDPGDEVRCLGELGHRTVDMWVKIVSITVEPEGDGTVSFGVVRTDKIS